MDWYEVNVAGRQGYGGDDLIDLGNSPDIDDYIYGFGQAGNDKLIGGESPY